MRKSIKSIFALVLALVLCASLGVAAFADDNDGYNGNAPVITKAAVTKELRMTKQTTTPTATFNFTTAKVSLDGDTANEKLATMPTLVVNPISFVPDNQGTTSDTGVKSVYGQSLLIFQGAWPHAGSYIYTVSESSTYSLTPANGVDKNNTTLTISSKVYTVEVMVKNDGNGGVTPEDIIISDETKDKKDATPDNELDENNNTTKIVDKPNGFIFTNDYTEKIGSFTLTQEVTGNMADMHKAFDYTVKVNAPTVGNVSAYPYTIYNADNTQVSTGSLTPSTVTTLQLTGNQHVEFQDILVGTLVSVQNINRDTNYKTTMSTKHTSTQGSITDPETFTASAHLYEGENTVTFTQNYEKTIPTGIVINNLPYILLIVVASVALAAFCVSTKRKKNEG